MSRFIVGKRSIDAVMTWKICSSCIYGLQGRGSAYLKIVCTNLGQEGDRKVVYQEHWFQCIAVRSKSDAHLRSLYDGIGS